jgi:hypothetical protein
MIAGWDGNFHRRVAKVAKGRRAGLGEKMGVGENVVSGTRDFFLKCMK